MKLHTKLGKPIPSSDPIRVNAASTATTQAPGTKTTTTTAPSVGTAAAKAKPVIKKVVTPKITFVGELARSL